MNQTYTVFARKESQAALTRLGTVSVAPGKSVEDAACAAHGEDWLELVAIPESDMSWTIREDDAR